MRRLALVVAAALAAGCATRPTPPPPPAKPRPATPVQPLPGVISPATYVAQAASIDLLVIRSSELALVRSPSRGIRDFASRMIAAHQGLAAQLSFAGRRLNLLPSAAMLPQHQAMYDALDSSGDFDNAYVRLQRRSHGAALSLHSEYAARGTSPTLRPVAENGTAVERSHLDMLRRL